MNWLIAVLDPFHDTEYSALGQPDGINQKNIVQVISQQVIIDPPGGLAATDKWQCMIFNNPDLSSAATTNEGSGSNFAGVIQSGVFTRYDYNATWGGTPTGFDTTYEMGLLNVIKAPASVTCMLPAGDYVGGVTQTVIGPTATSGQSRLHHLGFEASLDCTQFTNDGYVTTVRQPQTLQHGILVLGGDNATTPQQPLAGFSRAQLDNAAMTSANAFTPVVPVPVCASRLPPCNLSTLTQMGGVLQRRAEEGAYCVVPIDVDQNVMTGPSYEARLYTKGAIGTNIETQTTSALVGQAAILQIPDFLGGLQVGAFFPLADIGTNSTGLSQRVAIPRPTQPIPCDTAVAYFTGLNAGAKVRVMYKYGIEVCPTSDNTLNQVVHAPPARDDFALELYKHVRDKLPSSCPLSDNEAGDFWDRVLAAIETGVPMVSSMLGPQAKIIGTGVGMAAGLARKIRN